MLKKHRKDIGYTGPDLHLKPEIDPNVEVKKEWNEESYDKWVEEMSFGYEESGKDNDYGYEMAQNAKREKGLLRYIRYKIREDGGDETPLERIQWDIEALLP